MQPLQAGDPAKDKMDDDLRQHDDDEADQRVHQSVFGGRDVVALAAASDEAETGDDNHNHGDDADDDAEDVDDGGDQAVDCPGAAAGVAAVAASYADALTDLALGTGGAIGR